VETLCVHPSRFQFVGDTTAHVLLDRNTDFQNTQGIIFVVDSNDRERVAEAREERESRLGICCVTYAQYLL
jgi:hypothetical protein